MRMIGIGLMGFLLAGVALLLSTMDLLEKGQRYLNELTAGPQLVFESRETTASASEHRAVVYRANANDPIILSGLPAYQGVVFTLPMDARPTSGYLQIDVTSQVLKGVEGVLRISIDNARRAEMLLHPGEVGRSLRILLSPTDFARDQLVVSFSLQGAGKTASCSSDDGVQATVEIETTSAVFLTLDRPLTTARDQVAAWGQITRVAWPHWLNSQERMRRFVLATQFKQRHVETLFVDSPSGEALATVALRRALESFPAKAPERADMRAPHPIAQKGANAGLRRFHQSSTWRNRFDIRRDFAGLAPAALDLHLAFGRRLEQAPWNVTVTLNNRLIHQEILPNSESALQRQIALPQDGLANINTLEVTATVHHPASGTCDRGPELLVEMLPETALLVGKTRFLDGITEVQQALADFNVLSVGSLAPLTATDAEVASDLLAAILPARIALKPNMRTAQILLVAPGDNLADLTKSKSSWLIEAKALSTEPVARAVESGIEIARSGVAILVIPDGAPVYGEAS